MSFDLTPGEDLRQILGAAQSMLDTHYPVSRLRDGAKDDLAPLEAFGTFDLARSEAEGGAGFTLVEEAHLHVAFGRHLAPPAALATAIARRLDPEATAALGFVGDEAWFCAVQDDTDLVLARVPEGLMLANVTDDGAADSTMSPFPLRRVLPAEDNRRADSLILRTSCVLTSAQLLGVAIGARDLAVDYAKEREQFGRPIGSFQSIKHHAANMNIGIEMVSALLDMAAIAVRDERDDAEFQCAALTRLAPRAALEAARTCIQIHGGIGFSAEADAHLFLKQAHLLRQFLGSDDLMDQAAPLTPY